MSFLERVSVYTSSPDPTNQFVGSGPTLGDLGNTGIVIPDIPTPTQLNRYLIRLCGIRLLPDCKAIIRGIRQYVTIGAEVPLSEDPIPKVFVFEKQIITPTWKFTDGNIAWFITKNGPQQTDGSNPLPSSLAQPPLGFSPNVFDITPGILYNQLFTSPLNPYIPPFNGSPPGVIVNNQFSVWRDIRFAWQRFNTVDTLNFEINGPGDLCLWASVYQTNPLTRTNPPSSPPNPWLSPEDQFWSAYPSLARYYRIAGELLVDMYNADPTELEIEERRQKEECRQEKQDELLDLDLQNSRSSVDISTGSGNG